MLTIQSFVNSPVTSNCYVLFDRVFGNECIIVDPGSRSEKELIDYLDGDGLVPRFIILTHEHFDHCWGVNELVERYHIPIICSELCAEAIKYEKRNCSVFYDNKDAFSIKCDTITIESIEYTLKFNDCDIVFLTTPGHTNASISFTLSGCLFSGDTLIKDTRTVTKLPTGSVNKLLYSVDLYKNLQKDGLLVYPGHGNAFYIAGYDLDMMYKGT